MPNTAVTVLRPPSDGPSASLSARPSARRTTPAQRLAEHVERLGDQHPPIDLASVDFTVRDPAGLSRRFGHVLDYMARVELEVDRNVLELLTLLPDPPEVDRRFYADVWQPQEVRHGQILDELQVRIGRPPATPERDHVSAKLRVLGALGRLEAVQDVSRMLYYLTGMSTERSAVLAYNLLHDGVRELGEHAVADTVIAPIRRQEPGHYAFYKMSAQGLATELAGWQRWLVRRLRSLSYGPVGVNDDAQRADFGEVMITLGIDRDVDAFTESIARVERDLLWARGQGMPVPAYVVRAFREAVEAAHVRRAA
ncbi:GTP-binding protein LepA [Nocardioides sp. S-58]|uniref:GTP-binding protein LepA n=1 Tax=Nocardioides renjunii TaxID=3095075 RepID=A0ABU5K907_9ACTN|nr:GTP-binding protein LepA [Nocardioides sp. S-58]MDZ5661455.1 GTP-binding protein LepA [Nocardioides sp. S-58]